MSLLPGALDLWFIGWNGSTLSIHNYISFSSFQSFSCQSSFALHVQMPSTVEVKRNQVTHVRLGLLMYWLTLVLCQPSMPPKWKLQVRLRITKSTGSNTRNDISAKCTGTFKSKLDDLAKWYFLKTIKRITCDADVFC